jgi:hypothetical protein
VAARSWFFATACAACLAASASLAVADTEQETGRSPQPAQAPTVTKSHGVEVIRGATQHIEEPDAPKKEEQMRPEAAPRAEPGPVRIRTDTAYIRSHGATRRTDSERITTHGAAGGGASRIPTSGAGEKSGANIPTKRAGQKSGSGIRSHRAGER